MFCTCRSTSFFVRNMLLAEFADWHGLASRCTCSVITFRSLTRSQRYSGHRNARLFQTTPSRIQEYQLSATDAANLSNAITQKQHENLRTKVMEAFGLVEISHRYPMSNRRIHFLGTKLLPAKIRDLFFYVDSTLCKSLCSPLKHCKLHTWCNIRIFGELCILCCYFLNIFSVFFFISPAAVTNWDYDGRRNH